MTDTRAMEALKATRDELRAMFTADKGGPALRDAVRRLGNLLATTIADLEEAT